MNLAEKALALSSALDADGIPHAFGGALALIWCTPEVRATQDLDVNIFVEHTDVTAAVAALPDAIEWTDEAAELVARDGQVRVWWGSTPVDLFFDTTDFHRDAALRTRRRDFLGETLPALSCRDLAVFKAFFNRTKDWADLEAMAAAGALDVAAVCGVLVEYLGAEDPRIGRVRALVHG